MTSKKQNIKKDNRQGALFGEDFFDDEEISATASTDDNNEQMPHIEFIIPKNKIHKEEEKETPAIATPKPKQRLRFMSFGSGSSGNCAYFGNNDGGILIDAGVDSDFVFKSLLKNGITPEMVKGIILTHDHGDHVRYAYTIARRYKHIRIYCTPRLMNGLLRRHNISRRIKEYHENIFKEITFKIADFAITAFDTSHDGTDNMGFMIEYDNQKFVLATDMGIINARTAFYTAQANYLMIESNYDAKMLNEGSYPEYLKQRIRKDTGHLDNVVAASYVADIYSSAMKYLFLCHLSNDNNTPEIATHAMQTALEGKGVSVGDGSNAIDMRNRDIQLYALPRYDCSPLFVLTD